MLLTVTFSSKMHTERINVFHCNIG